MACFPLGLGQRLRHLFLRQAKSMQQRPLGRHHAGQPPDWSSWPSADPRKTRPTERCLPPPTNDRINTFSAPQDRRLPTPPKTAHNCNNMEHGYNLTSFNPADFNIQEYGEELGQLDRILASSESPPRRPPAPRTAVGGPIAPQGLEMPRDIQYILLSACSENLKLQNRKPPKRKSNASHSPLTGCQQTSCCHRLSLPSQKVTAALSVALSTTSALGAAAGAENTALAIGGATSVAESTSAGHPPGHQPSLLRQGPSEATPTTPVLLRRNEFMRRTRRSLGSTTSIEIGLNLRPSSIGDMERSGSFDNFPAAQATCTSKTKSSCQINKCD